MSLSIEEFEKLAEEFLKDTGVTAPSRDQRVHTIEWTLRQQFWHYWRKTKCRIEALEDELNGLRAFQKSVNEALNRGDGIYRP